MNFGKDKIKSLYGNAVNNVEIEGRFDRVDEIINEVLHGNSVKFENDNINYNIIIEGEVLKRKQGTISKGCFGPASDGLTQPEAYSGVAKMSEEFDDKYQDLIRRIGSLLGGFDFNNNRMIDKYRIISNSITSIDDYKGSLTSQGLSRHPSSHFADNNYFFNVMYFIQHANEENILKNSHLVLRYPGKYFKVEGDDKTYSKECDEQQKILSSRFPPKFLWMWANKEEVIHPISLMAFRNFLDTDFGKEILKEINKDYTPESVVNMEFDNFKKVWKTISDSILNEVVNDFSSLDDAAKKEHISNISRLISIITIEDTDIKNISDLLKTGNRAVILWGPPGTGKTYESEQVVKELLNVPNYYTSELFERVYNFSTKKTSVTNISGYYEIVQFHPNYTYQDFIGGIAPMLDDSSNNISYILNHGIFKRFCDEANNNKDKKYIFIIDEINRAELSAVFGELLYALEYRGKSVNLPNFKEPFTIPENVYIIGTMNNVDKSLVTFDLALRRRFGFFKLMPKLDVLEDVLSDKIEENSLQKYIEKCKQLNLLIAKDSFSEQEKNILEEIRNYQDISLGLGEDYQVGQAYFLKITDFMPQINKKDEKLQITSFDLEKLWSYNIEPLLEEYLGMSIEDDTVSSKLKKLKEWFEKI